jgi:hypothetical protein
MLSMMELGAGLANEGTDMDAVYKCVEGIAYIFLSDATALEGDGASEQQPHYRKHHTHPQRRGQRIGEELLWGLQAFVILSVKRCSVSALLQCHK